MSNFTLPTLLLTPQERYFINMGRKVYISVNDMYLGILKYGFKPIWLEDFSNENKIVVQLNYFFEHQLTCYFILTPNNTYFETEIVKAMEYEF